MLDNEKQETYCQLRAEGKSQRQAYLEAFPSSRRWKPETVDSKACVLEKNGKVLERLRELKTENEQKAGLSRKSLLARLEGIIGTEDVRFRGADVIKAIELYSALCGYGEQQTEDAQQVEAHKALVAAIERAKHAD